MSCPPAITLQSWTALAFRAIDPHPAADADTPVGVARARGLDSHPGGLDEHLAGAGASLLYCFTEPSAKPADRQTARRADSGRDSAPACSEGQRIAVSEVRVGSQRQLAPAVRARGPLRSRDGAKRDIAGLMTVAHRAPPRRSSHAWGPRPRRAPRHLRPHGEPNADAQRGQPVLLRPTSRRALREREGSGLCGAPTWRTSRARYVGGAGAASPSFVTTSRWYRDGQRGRLVSGP